MEDEDCTGGNWDSPRTIQVSPVDGTEATVTISHAVWDDHGGTPLEDMETPAVVVTIYDNDPPPSEPPWVSIEAGSSSTLTEGDPVTFTLTRGNDDITQTRTVDVRVSESGTMLSGSPPTSVEFAANSAIATLEVQTVDDQVDEDDSVITATITASSEFPNIRSGGGHGYRQGHRHRHRRGRGRHRHRHRQGRGRHRHRHRHRRGRGRHRHRHRQGRGRHRHRHRQGRGRHRHRQGRGRHRHRHPL